MRYLNVNAIHNYLNLIGVIVGALLSYDWTMLGLSASQAATVASVVLLADKIVKLLMNIMRDGVGGLFLPQPPVEK